MEGRIGAARQPGPRRDHNRMKKLNDLHAGHGIKEEETVTTNFPAPAFTESKPKGVNIGPHDAHIDSSVAANRGGESRSTGTTKPGVNSQSEARAGKR